MLKKSDITRLQQIRIFIKTNLDKELTLQSIAAMFSISVPTLRRHFSSYYKIPLYSFILQCRMRKAKQLILKNEFDLNELSILVGYKRYTSFFHTFRGFYGMTPSALKRNAELLMSRMSKKMSRIR